MFLAAVHAGHCPGFELGGGETVLFDHHPGYIQLLRYRTPHQDSLDHAATISHPMPKSSLNVGHAMS